MKRKVATCFAIFALLYQSTHVYAQSSQEAISYMKEITASFDELKNETWQYLKAITRGKGAKKVESKRQKLLSELQEVKLNVKKMGSFQKDNTLKNAVIQYLDLTRTILNEDFDKILNMEEIAEQSYDMMEAYLLAKEKANAKLDSASEMMNQAEKAFAAKYGINLVAGEEDKMTQKIKRASEMLGYYNHIYLIFFKSYKQEFYVLDALQRNDVNALEQHAGTLALFANQGIEKLEAEGNFHNDANLRIAAQQVLDFYKIEAEKDFPAIISFYIKKDNFEKLQKIIESKPKKDLTQQDIDQFNKAVNEYNQAVKSYKQSSEIANQKRAKLLEEWNKKVEAFFDKHAG